MAEMLNTQIGASKSWNGQYTVDCSKVPSLPDLTLTFGGKPYVLKGTDYVLEVQGTCISSFTGLDINLPGGGSLWIIGASYTFLVTTIGVLLLNVLIGDVFLRKYYTVYDAGKDDVGFALAA